MLLLQIVVEPQVTSSVLLGGSGDGDGAGAGVGVGDVGCHAS